MTIIDNYNPLDGIRVSREEVEEQERLILDQLERNQIISIYERYNNIQNQTLNYSKNDAERVLQGLTEQISIFMAYQEALFKLMREGQIMPIKIPNSYTLGRDDIVIRYSENWGGCIYSGQRHLSIPIFVHEQFIKTPSLRS